MRFVLFGIYLVWSGAGLLTLFGTNLNLISLILIYDNDNILSNLSLLTNKCVVHTGSFEIVMAIPSQQVRGREIPLIIAIIISDR